LPLRDPTTSTHAAAGQRERHGPPGPVLAVVVLTAAFVASAVRSGGGQDLNGLYQDTVITTGSDLRYRAAGFARALRAVLVRVSGEPRLLHDPRVDRLAAEADLFVASFHYVDQLAGIKHHDDQGTYDRPFNLTVRFVPALIDKALIDLGAPPWRDRRPMVVPVIAVQGVGNSYLLDGENPAGGAQRAALVAVAGEFGLTVRFPTPAQLAAWEVTSGRFPAPPAAPSADQALVTGILEFHQALPGWVGSWKMQWRGNRYTWGIRGVNFDEAFRNLVRGVTRIASGRGAPD
jgi:uncharacterized protein